MRKTITPFFSIVIPVYDVAPYLQECLDSVLAQEVKVWECICVDDGSTDGSGAILDEYALRDARFRVFHQPNCGVSAARNLALAQAQGAWVAFLDGDDVWASGWLAGVQQLISAYPGIDWISAPQGDIDFVDRVPVALDLSNDVSGVSQRASMNLVATAWHQVSRCGYMGAHFFRREALSGLSFDPTIRFREDALFLFEATFNLSHGVVAPHLKGYCRRVRKSGATQSPQSPSEALTLLCAFEQVCQRIFARAGNASLPLQARMAAAFWVTKSVRAWRGACPNHRLVDAFRVWRRVWRLRCMGVVAWSTGSTRWNTWRWRLFVLTGWGRCLGA